MKIRVVSAIGGGEAIVNLPPTAPISELKKIVAQQRRIPPQTVVVVFRGQQLSELDEQTGKIITIEDAGIANNDKVYLITRTEGG
ncbi:MAG: ubiquitin-like protein [Candidatus Hermodarchaeota archaeon]